MPRSIYTTEHQRLVALLREARTDAGLSQAEVADRLERHQSFVSKYESGQRRLDLVELAQITEALDIKLVTLVRRFVGQR